MLSPPLLALLISFATALLGPVIGVLATKCTLSHQHFLGLNWVDSTLVRIRNRTRTSHMHWMFTGYLASFYAVLTLHAAFTMDSHSRPLHGLVAHFVLIPALIAAVSAESIFLAPIEWKVAIQDALFKRTLTRVYAFCSGFFTGIMVLGCFAAAYFLYDLAHYGRVALLQQYDSKIFYGSTFILLFLVALSPTAAGYWLVRKVTRRGSA